MKNLYLIVLVFFIGVAGLKAQNPLQNGEKQLNAGFGMSGYGLPIYVGIDFGVAKDLTVGAEISYRSYKEKWYSSDYSFTLFGFLGNANYHFNTVLNIPSKWDFYAGLNLGFYSWSTPSGWPGGAKNSGLGLGAQIGGRVSLTDKFALNLELTGGNTVSGAKFGISVKI